MLARVSTDSPWCSLRFVFLLVRASFFLLSSLEEAEDDGQFIDGILHVSIHAYAIL